MTMMHVSVSVDLAKFAAESVAEWREAGGDDNPPSLVPETFGAQTSHDWSERLWMEAYDEAGMLLDNLNADHPIEAASEEALMDALAVALIEYDQSHE